MPKNAPGKLVIIDGIDGSGKGTLVAALAGWAKRRHLKVFDLRAFGRQHHTLPEPEQLKKHDVILSAEPTFSLVGQAIREEIVRHNGRDYTAMETAQAYALDRLILYRRILIPLLAMGKIIFQERGFTTSLIYQPIQKDPISVKEVLSLRGNRLALHHRPDLLIIADVPPRLAIRRLARRLEKKDDHIFERLNFLKKARLRFMAGWFRKLFITAGSSVAYVDTDKPQSQSEKEAIRIWETFVNS